MVDPHTILVPYDLCLRQLTAREHENRGNRIAVELTVRFPAGTVLWFHAGSLSCDAIAPVVVHQVRFPLARLSIGQQLAWHRKQQSTSSF
jgi:Family of unknown function (DUF6884)